MSEYRNLLERDISRLSPPRIPFEELERRRDRKRRDQRIRAGVLGLALAIAAAWLGASAIRSGPSPADDTPNPAPAPSAPIDDYVVDLGTGSATPMPEAIVRLGDGSGGYQVSPDGRALLFEVLDGDTSITQLYVANVDGSNVRLVTNEPGGAVGGAWSPDGMKIAYVAGWRQLPGVSLVLLNLGTGRTTELVRGLMDGGPQGVVVDVRDFPFPSFSPDGQTVLFSSEGFFLETVSSAGGEVTRLHGDAAWGAYSPDGETISFLNSLGYNVRVGLWDYGGLVLEDADGRGEQRHLTDAEDHSVWSPDGTRIAFEWKSQVRIVDVATGSVTKVAIGVRPAWLDDDTLIVERYEAIDR
jgi:Tol biopolymer transport system component